MKAIQSGPNRATESTRVKYKESAARNLNRGSKTASSQKKGTVVI